MEYQPGSRYSKASLSIALLLFSTLSFTDPGSFISTPWVIGLSGETGYIKAGKYQIINITPTVLKGYAANKRSRTIFSGGLFVGKHLKVSDKLALQLGVNFSSTTNHKLAGLIYDDADAAFDNYRYQYKVQHKGIEIKGKLISNSFGPVSPWVAGSMGLGINRAHSFTNRDRIPTAVVNNNFRNHTHAAFSYSLTFGIEGMVDDHWRIGVGGQISDWGLSRLARAAGQTQESGIKLHNMYAQTLQFQLSYHT